MNKIKTLINKKQIKKRIKTIAKEIDKDFKDEQIIIICVLKGSFYFVNDIIRKLKNKNILIDFVKIKSYNNTSSTNNIDFQLDTSFNLKNKNIIIIDDILDTGNTLYFLTNHIKKMGPKKIKTCVLLNKQARRKKEINADYVGFEIDNNFVVGYGLDYEEKYRQLQYIAILKK